MKPDHSQSLLKMKYAGLSENYDRLVNDYNRLQEQHERLQRDFNILAGAKVRDVVEGVIQYRKKRP